LRGAIGGLSYWLEGHGRPMLRNFPKQYLLAAVLILGLALRLPFLGSPGTGDMYYFRMWGAQALHSGLVNVYSLTDQDVVTLLLLSYRRIPVHVRVSNPTDLGLIAGVPDYPPGSISVLQLAVAFCRFLQGGALQAGPLLNACLNLAPVLFSFGIVVAAGLFMFRERRIWPLTAMAAFWLNPAVILTSPILGYQDPIFAFFGLLSMMFCFRKRYTASVLALALACVTKPQGAFVVPIIATALLADGSWRMLWRYSGRFVLFVLLPLLPFVVAGRFLGIMAGVFQQMMYPALSAQQANIWWIVGGGIRALETRSLVRVLVEVPMVSRAEFAAFTGFSPLLIALPAFAGFTAVNLYLLWQQLRQDNRWAIFWSAALEVFGYSMLMMYTHEQHLFAFFVYSLPLLALEAKPIFRLFCGLCLTYGINLFLFEGFGEGFKEAARRIRSLAGLDLTVLVALANIAIFSSILMAKRWRYEDLVPR
jgi:hypothetical protein